MYNDILDEFHILFKLQGIGFTMIGDPFQNVSWKHYLTLNR